MSATYANSAKLGKPCLTGRDRLKAVLRKGRKQR